MSGYLCVIEGIEGAGKTTCANALTELLKALDLRVVLAQEPGTSKVGIELRRVVKDPQLTITPEASLHIFSAARTQVIKDVIRPALDEGMIVILDRYYPSSIAYQAYGEGLDLEVVTRTCLDVVRDARPDRIFFLDIGVDVMRDRLRLREEGTDRYEQMDTGFHERVRRGYREQLSDPVFKLIEGELPKDKVLRRVLHAVLDDLKPRRLL